jgi:3',5'-cyclic AMP phosphodiesterase CpdA
MAAPAIVLRFRDTTPGIDTIVEHRALLAKHGAVGWGWWKKTFEEGQEDAIAQLLAASDEFEVALVDRSTERAFRCTCIGFSVPSNTDAASVPEYYRHHIDMTAGVFIFKKIDDTAFDPEMGDAIGDQTFLWAGSKADSDFGHIASTATASGRSCVLHISDLHFGSDYGFRLQNEDVALGDARKTLTECITGDLDRLGLREEIAAVIVTGDFMTHGKFTDEIRTAAIAEFDALRVALNLARDQIIPVPGNHDVVRYPEGVKIDVRENAVEVQARYDHETPFRTFVDELIGRDWKASLNYVRRVELGDTDLDVCVLNSCTIVATEWTEYGYVGRSGIDAISELAQQPIERPTFRFLALHHHLLPVASVEALNKKGISMTLDASDILSAGQMACAHVALHGHQHKAKVAMYQGLGLNGEQTDGPIYVVANGSASAKNSRLPAGQNNTYALLRLHADGIDLWIRELRLNGQIGLEAFRGVLPLPPIMPAKK